MKRKLGVILFVIIEILLFYVEKKYINIDCEIDRFLILSFVNFFCCCHLFFSVRKMYDYIYKKRYIIALVCLIVFSLLEYHGSSISYWNDVIQPNFDINDGGIILGVARKIRGDEFFVTTPSIISQYFNNFEPVSNLLMGRTGYVNMFPTLPSRDISILGNLFNLPYLFLPLANAFSMSWFLELFLIFFASFELCMLVSKNNRLYALMGAMMITFSGASCWWSNMNVLAWGALAIVIINLFLKSDKIYKKILYSIAIGIIGANYLMLMYPAWQVSFGYLYLGFVIWLLIENRKRLNYKILLYIPIALAVMFGIFLPVFLNSYSIYLQIMSTVYPGERVSVGGSGMLLLISYYLNLYFPVIKIYNPSEISNFLSFFPLPIIMSFIAYIKSLIKEIKFDSLLLILTVIGFLLSIWNFLEIPVWLSKVTLLSFSTPERSQLVVGYICIFILIRMFSLYENNDKIFKKKFFISVGISLIFNVIVLMLTNKYYGEHLNDIMILILMILFVPIVSLIILNNKKTNMVLALLLIFTSFMTGAIVNPISKGIDVFFEKPVAKEIRNIVDDDKDGRWLVVNDLYSLPNYVLANGAITINSTSYYPNMELWKKIDPDGENEFIYNRYAHTKFKIIEDETNFELLYPDTFIVNLDNDDLDELEVDYILAEYDIGKYIDDMSHCLYSDDGMYIYEID